MGEIFTEFAITFNKGIVHHLLCSSNASLLNRTRTGLYLACQVESSLSVSVCQVDIAVAVNQQGHQTFELLFVSSPDVAVHGCIAIHVQCIVITHLHQ